MVRVILYFCVVCLFVAAPAAARQEADPPPAAGQQPSGLSILAAALEARGGLQEVSANHWRIVNRVDIPIGQGIRIFADEVDLFLDTGQLVAQGNVSFTNPEGLVSAERLEYNFDDGTATFDQAVGIVSLGPLADRAAFGNQDPDVYFYGDKIEKLGPKKYRITRGGFSTCVQPTPRWEVTSKSIVINLDDYAMARATTLRVKGVPLLYLPAIYYPLQEDQRSTGFLLPTYGTSTLRGGSLSNAFFWAIGRSQDATFYHDWFTKTGTGMGAEYRYVSGVMSSGNVRFYRFDQRATRFERDGRVETLNAALSYQVNATVYQDLGRRLKAQGTVEYFTDVTTQQLYHQDVRLSTNARRVVEGGVSGTFGTTTVGAYYSRQEQFTDNRNSFVYGSMPRATASVAPARLFGTPMYASLNSEFIFQPNRRLRDGIVTQDDSIARFDLAPTLRVPLSRLTFLSVNTNAAYRQTYFSRSLDAAKRLTKEPLTRRYLSLQTDVVGPVLSKVWDTPGSSYSERMKHVIEPTFGVEYITEIANQAFVPLSDSTAVAVGGAMKFTYGLTNRLIARSRPADGGTVSTTREFLTVGVQQTYYTDRETSKYDTTYVSYSGRPRPVDLSPIAVTARVSPTATFDANARLEYDVNGNGLQILSAGSTLTAGASSGTVSFSRQRFRRDGPISSYISGSTTVRFLDGRMSTMYALNWDIDARYIYSQGIGATYLAQCCGVQADYQVVNYPPSLRSPIPSDRRVNFAFVLAGLGTFSNFFGLFGGQQ